MYISVYVMYISSSDKYFFQAPGFIIPATLVYGNGSQDLRASRYLVADPVVASLSHSFSRESKWTVRRILTRSWWFPDLCFSQVSDLLSLRITSCSSLLIMQNLRSKDFTKGIHVMKLPAQEILARGDL